MKIVDSYHLPEDLVEAIRNDPYDRGNSDYSCTDLVKPPQALILERRHDAEIEVEAIDRIPAVLGQAVHALLERAAKDDGALREKRLFATVPTAFGDAKISGQVDHFRGGIVRDYKVVKASSALYGTKDEWKVQVNILAWLLRENGYHVTHGEIIAIYKDWDYYSQQDELRKANRLGKVSKYPKCEAGTIPIVMMDNEAVRATVIARVTTLKKMERLKDEALMECYDSERWDRGKGPVRCTGGKRGRPFCPVVEFCHQMKREGRR